MNKREVVLTERHVDEVPKEEKKSELNWLGLTATFVSGIAATLTLLGYGVSFSAESMLGIPHSSVFESALDLSDLAGYAISQLINHASVMLFDRTLYVALYSKAWPVIGFAVCAALVLAALAWRWGRRRVAVKPKPAKKLGGRAFDPAKQLRNAMLGLAVAFPLLPLLAAAVIAGMCALCALVAVAPVLGMTAGESYIREWVVEPAICVPTASRENRMKLNSRSPTGSKGPKAATCVIVLKDGRELGRGRVVFMTTKSAVLYDPASGAVNRVPISTNVVQVVASLDAVAPASASASSAQPSPLGASSAAGLQENTLSHRAQLAPSAKHRS